ncbi:MAG: hypothetical protein NC453_03955 [Muribaculum sp.]|nr:hypothetical protein [Muribaculum sp.]
MKIFTIRKIAIAAVAAASSLAMTSCSGWWIGSNGWGLTQQGPGGINIGVSGGWGALNPGPSTPPPPQNPGPGPGGPEIPPPY